MDDLIKQTEIINSLKNFLMIALTGGWVEGFEPGIGFFPYISTLLSSVRSNFQCHIFFAE